VARLLSTAFGLLCALTSCSSTPERPPPPQFVGRAIENPTTCGDLPSAERTKTGFLFDGGPAGCVAEGLECPLLDSGPDACAAGELPFAECVGELWRPTCAGRADGI
jgi:hypothetical protein